MSQCEAEVWTDVWHPHQCQSKAKKVCFDKEGSERPVCGTHYRVAEKSGWVGLMGREQIKQTGFTRPPSIG